MNAKTSGWAEFLTWDELTLDSDLWDSENKEIWNLATIILSAYCSLNDDKQPERSILLHRSGELCAETWVGVSNLSPASNPVIDSESFQIPHCVQLGLTFNIYSDK